VALRPQPVAGAEAVTHGDLFEGASGAAAKVVVAPAPAPGARTVLDAGLVSLAARNAGLDWANPTGLRRIMVGAAAAGPGAPSARREPVLTYSRNIAAGEIVTAADLVWSDQAVAAQGSVGDPERAIGLEARQPLRAGAPVQPRDLSAPTVVERNDIIAVAFESGGISLTLQGKALKDAAVGDSVQVMNMQSRKVIEAVAAGPGRAVVGPAAQALKARAFTTASLR
jgi:flagella basal body P-ring formation protein FlgA